MVRRLTQSLCWRSSELRAPLSGQEQSRHQASGASGSRRERQAPVSPLVVKAFLHHLNGVVANLRLERGPSSAGPWQLHL
jgi:hypothetical protein